ncbi:PasA protein [Pseudomonas stutzeri]|nr:PasA protein [Stutzerimonas stutzeri]
MANELYTRTNQKIYFAGLALDAWRAADAAQAINVATQVQAARETALFHLYGAVLGLCHEIAGFYRLPQARLAEVEQLLCREVLDAAPGPELAELVELAQDRQSWLGCLLAAYRALFEPPREERKAKVDPALELIEALDVGAPAPVELDLATLTDWQQRIKALAMRFRQGMSEW